MKGIYAVMTGSTTKYYAETAKAIIFSETSAAWVI